MSKALEIADALVTTLNTKTWPVTVTAKRYILPRFEVPDLNTVQLSIVPKGPKKVLQSRNAMDRVDVIQIGIQKRLSDVNTEADAFISLVDAISDYLMGLTVADTTCTAVVLHSDEWFFEEHLVRNGFTALIEASFQSYPALND